MWVLFISAIWLWNPEYDHFQQNRAILWGYHRFNQCVVPYKFLQTCKCVDEFRSYGSEYLILELWILNSFVRFGFEGGQLRLRSTRSVHTLSSTWITKLHCPSLWWATVCRPAESLTWLHMRFFRKIHAYGSLESPTFRTAPNGDKDIWDNWLLFIHYCSTKPTGRVCHTQRPEHWSPRLLHQQHQHSRGLIKWITLTWLDQQEPLENPNQTKADYFWLRGGKRLKVTMMDWKGLFSVRLSQGIVELWDPK